MRRLLKQVVVVASVISFLAPAAMAKRGFDFRHFSRAKNVIMLVPDGCDETVQTLARWYQGEDLHLDSMQGGSMKIHMANSVITGSAAAATAFSSGHKTSVRFLGIGPRDYDLLEGLDATAAPYAPVASVLEAAKLAGKATGLVATSRITHATPAAFASHIEDRGWDNDIMEHMVYNNVDVIFGGGARHLIPQGSSYTTTFGATWNGRRTDGENLMDVLASRGYQFVDNKTDMYALDSGKAWGLFDDSHLDPDIDRETLHPTQPSIAEMTEKAIELLSQDRDGFFLMVEGSQVDWAGHNNDPIYMVTDFLAFDKAVKAAVDFAERDGNTIVLAFPDHNTGGMKIGHYNAGVHYTSTTIEDLVGPLQGMTMSANALAAQIEDFSNFAEVSAAVLEHWGIAITEADLDEINMYENSGSMSYALANVISKNHTVIGWSTHGHNGETVPVWSYGMDIKGVIDNTELAKIAADAMGLRLRKATRKLYVDVRDITDIDNIEFDITTDEDGNEETGEIIGNGVLRIGEAEFPINKDYMVYYGKMIQLPGLTVYASGDANVDETAYISRRAVRILRSLGQI